MLRQVFLPVIFVCCWAIESSSAGLVGLPEIPTFSADDTLIIRRNEALAALTETDPWLVRRALDAMATAPAVSSRSADTPSNNKGKRKSGYEQPPQPQRNPDLDSFSRTSPEAAHDLFLLIKQARRPLNQ